MTVTDISEPRLIMLFIEGLIEPLRGWVKAYRPHTLYYVILHTRDLADSTSKTKNFPKPVVPQEDWDRKPIQRKWKCKEKFNDATRHNLMRRKLCFTCKIHGSPTIGAWARDKSITLRLSQTMMRRNRAVRHMTVSPLAQRRSHCMRSSLQGDHQHREGHNNSKARTSQRD
jgi:hypothetical protein